MLGSPKFKRGDKVVFTIDGRDVEGEVYIIDAYGTWQDNTDVSYDILVNDGDCGALYKHISEHGIRKIDT